MSFTRVGHCSGSDCKTLQADSLKWVYQPLQQYFWTSIRLCSKKYSRAVQHFSVNYSCTQLRLNSLEDCCHSSFGNAYYVVKLITFTSPKDSKLLLSYSNNRIFRVAFYTSHLFYNKIDIIFHLIWFQKHLFCPIYGNILSFWDTGLNYFGSSLQIAKNVMLLIYVCIYTKR